MTCQVKGCPAKGHTPGPWETYVHDIRMKGYITTIAEAKIFRPSRDTNPHIHEPERDANAALIARAPALAHALVGLVEAAKRIQRGPLFEVIMGEALAAAEEVLKP